MRSRRHVGFLTQAVLIAVPLIILSTVALYSLRQDKASIEQDARERATTLISELARQWGQHISKEFAELSKAQSLDFILATQAMQAAPPKTNQAVPAGSHREARFRDHLDQLPQLQCYVINDQIRSPVDYSRLPMPPDWPRRLTPSQLGLWRSAEIQFQLRSLEIAKDATAALVAARLPEAVLANAEFNLAVLAAGPNAAAKQSERMTALARRYPEALTEAGTPIADLALIRALSLSSDGRLPDGLMLEVSRRIIVRPSFLTPELLEALERVSENSGAAQWVQVLKRLWLAQEKARILLHLLLQREAPCARSQIWLDAEGESFLALCQPFSSTAGRVPACQVTLLPSRILDQILVEALAQTGVKVPAYATAVVQIGDRRWSVPSASHSPNRGERHGSPELAHASGQLQIQPEFPVLSFGATNESLPVTGSFLSYPLRIGLELTNQDLLFARYRQRLWLSAGLVLLAAAAAGIGLVIAWRAFQRQRRLAEMTSDFVSSVSHEFRAPLASVRLMAESLDQGRVTNSEKRGEYFRLILQECSRLSSLVENVLDFSRIDQGRRQYEFEHFDLMAMVNQTIRLMEPSADERQVKFILAELPAGADKLQPCWDAQAVQQALVNLIDNAIKHSSAGGLVRITVELMHRNGDNTPDKIRVSVHDQGRGIPPAEIERVFEPFYRSGSELRRETKGIGIGLSIVKHVAEAHEGRVVVQSLVGKGSCFTLELPLR